MGRYIRGVGYVEFKDLAESGQAILPTIRNSVNEFGGRASTFGKIDSVGEMTVPGAFKDSLAQFVDRGFISWAHDWNQPVGYILNAFEGDDGLWVRWKFHGDAEAQRKRAIVAERLGAKKSVGLSIGYRTLDFRMQGKVKALTKIHLFEVAIVTVPAESGAHVTGSRSGTRLR